MSMFKSFTSAVSKASKVTCIRSFHSTYPVRSLDEFFKGYDNFQVGRAWMAGELRIKSDEDLQKLHFVCLKELNMLLTYKHYVVRNPKVKMINPDRIAKVKRTMQLIQHVVGERRKIIKALEKDKKYSALQRSRTQTRRFAKLEAEKKIQRGEGNIKIQPQDKVRSRKVIGKNLSPRRTL